MQLAAHAGLARVLADVGQRLCGRPLSADDLFSLFGVDFIDALSQGDIAGQSIEITWEQDGTVKVEVHGAILSDFVLILEGGESIYVERIAVRDHYQGAGIGVAWFARVVDAARRLGVPYIELRGARTKTENGYYTWARFGFTQPGFLPHGFLDARQWLLERIANPHVSPEAYAQAPQHLRDLLSLEQVNALLADQTMVDALMLSAGVMQLADIFVDAAGHLRPPADSAALLRVWQLLGDTTGPVAFGLDPGSLSSRILTAYLDGKVLDVAAIAAKVQALHLKEVARQEQERLERRAREAEEERRRQEEQSTPQWKPPEVSDADFPDYEDGDWD